jgi:hypothetical protein
MSAHFASCATRRDHSATYHHHEIMTIRPTLLALAWGALALTPTRAADLPAQVLPTYGGAGGTSFTRSCGVGRVITGLRYRAGLVVDAIGLLCRTVNADGTLSSESSIGSMAGGGGGTAGVARCAGPRVLTQLSLYYGSVVDGLSITCMPWEPATRTYRPTDGTTVHFGRTGLTTKAVERCESNRQPAVSIRGRAGGVVDAFGFTCDEP